MIAVCFMGTFNDNFYRQGAMLLAVAGGLVYLQSYIMFLFTLPFIVFAAYAGFLADRFSKRSVIITSKLISLAAFVAGAVGLYIMSWPIIFMTIFIIGVQAAIFSPAVNGSIPELYTADYVVAANGIIIAAMNTAILLGIAAVGFVLDARGTTSDVPVGLYLAAGIGIITALVILVLSLLVPKFPAASPKAKFPWAGPVESVIILAGTAGDPLLANSIFAKAFFWFAGALQILIITPLGLNQFGLSKTMTSILIVIELVGVGIGSLLAPLIAKGARWYRVLAPAGIIMSISMFVIAAVPYLPLITQKAVVILALAMMGVAGGIFSIPVTSFVQIRPAPQMKGRMIASSNLADFTGILLASGVFYVFDKLRLMPSSCFAIEAIMTMAMAGWLLISLRGRTENA
jgi:MFS family permease